MPITSIGAAPLIVDGFRRVRLSTVPRGAIIGTGAEYDPHSRARMAKRRKTGRNMHTPDAHVRPSVRLAPRHDCFALSLSRPIERERVLTVPMLR